MRIINLLILLLVSSCGLDYVEVEKDTVEPVDIVKQITLNENDLLDQQKFNQYNYVINSQNRLLLKFKKMLEVKENIETSEDDRVFIDFKLVNSNARFTNLRLCPMQTNWTFHATWDFRSQTRKWREGGGDINLSECVQPLSFDKVFDPRIDKPFMLESDDRIVFDITEMVQSHIKGGSQNHGWVLINDVDSISIQGEGQALGTAGAPRLYWTERESVLVPVWIFHPRSRGN